MFDITPYDSTRQAEWDAFVRQSKNGTFLLLRSYMDYHADRFTDCSLMLYKRGKLWAVLPANVAGDTLYSHQGLTYGGMVMGTNCTGADVLTAFDEINGWLRAQGLKRVVYKPVPHIYHSVAAEEDLYALWRCGAKVVARGLSTCIDIAHPLKWRQTRRTALNTARANGVTVCRSDSLAAFWQVLEDNLMAAHGVRPVHTLSEMQLLQSRHPDHIVLYEAHAADGTLLGGVLLYLTAQVTHSQYISATAEGKRLGAIDTIMHHVLANCGSRHFDFGVSTEQGGNVLNESLLFQKEGFGGRAVCYDSYEYELS